MLATRIIGNSITFIAALTLVILFFSDERVYTEPSHELILDVIFCITFLSIFIIQKSVNRFSAAINLKINELVASHGDASNRIINIEDKTEQEIRELAKHYTTLAEKLRDSDSMQSSQSIEHVIEEMKKDDENNAQGIAPQKK
ncbi:hypothetical protein BH09BAC2_BH09BAC2_02250 [soil metagenome]